jgi:hypothetical protein
MDPVRFFLTEESLGMQKDSTVLHHHKHLPREMQMVQTVMLVELAEPETKHDLHLTQLDLEERCPCGEFHSLINVMCYTQSKAHEEILKRHLEAAGREMARLNANKLES